MSTVGQERKNLKVILLGDNSVGKTCLLGRYADDFYELHDTTIGSSYRKKQWGSYNIIIWDTAGNERFDEITVLSCRYAEAAILAFDMNDRNSFEALRTRFIPMLSCTRDDCLRVVVATKMDLAYLYPDRRKISTEEGKQLSCELNKHIDLSKCKCEPYFEVSSKYGDGVVEMFEFIFQHCLVHSAEQQKEDKEPGKCVCS